MSAKDDATLNSKCHISALCQSFCYDAMAYKRWFDHGLVLDADNNISINDFNTFIKSYLTKDEDMDYLKAEKIRKEIELAQIKIDTERGEFYRTDVVHEIINALMVTVRDRVLQLKQDTPQVYTAGTQLDAESIMTEIARTALVDIHERLGELTQRISAAEITVQEQADNKNKKEAQDTDATEKPRRGRPRKAP